MISLTDIHKSFGDNHVLKGVSIVVPEGGVTALIGASGSGKSTLLRCANLLEIPQSGEVRIDDAVIEFTPGGKVGRKDLLPLRRKTGMVFQNFQLFPHLTALENVMEGLLVVLNWPQEQARQRALELLDKVGMTAKADAWPSSLSGGQQQRVAIARALAPAPKVLLCDEPTSALDPQLAGEVVEVLSQLAREGTTMLMATHDLRLAAKIATNVVFLQDGEVVEAGPVRQVFGAPKDERTKRFITTLTAQHPDLSPQ
ncbi:ATP-binding protein [Devosia limi DSM 17137]|uniref:ATP-binding protein n=1 Tax=Devosia limi DSM 17137 TaxID=1121477 RepID=A0A0F5LK87_9HYPH|nr:amino acid ABC transporter ATP-binding protein [Devosia limi]KKB82831.1 ATP-binding protein [Devosia limi DSM 17137]SHF48778.1 amino acid ABC transporter ATP-binding protein, PAAT family (TC 3.A.1.3.-) [Devosia limi DSM 17137]